MQPTSKKFLEVPQVTPFALASPRADMKKSTLADILQKSTKSLDDAELIYEKIKGFPCFNAFFAQNFRNLEINSILELCRNFKYESIEQYQPVYLQGQSSNGKYYVILSGEVAETVAEKSLGNFGDDPNSAGANKLRKIPKIVIHSVPRDSGSKADALMNSDSKKAVSFANIISSQEKRPTTSPFQLLSVREFDAASPRTPELFKNRKSPEEINSRKSSTTKKRRGSSSNQSSGMQKMRAVVRTITAVRGMQKALESRLKNVQNDENFELDAGTLNYLDQEIESESEDETLNEEDKKEFEEETKKYGQLMRYVGKGEGFGEQGLKKNTRRAASMICRTNCEFLVLEKQQYDVVFGRVQREKEEFLRTVFPNLDLNCMSTANFNYLMCSFKSETYGRGAHVLKEGRVAQKEAKIYVIQQGECVLEKNIIKELANPYDKTKPLVSTVEPKQLAVLGKGSIVGEEVIETHNQYEYSVRVTSDHVLVQAISRRDFKSKFPWDFHDFLAGIYEQKRNYREIAFEKSKIKTMDKENQYKKENIYCLKNTQMNVMVSKPAIHGLSRRIHREHHHSAKKEDAILESVITSPMPKAISTKTDGLRSGVDFIENQEEPLSGLTGGIKEIQRLLSPRTQTRLKESTKDEQPKTKDAMLLARIEFLNKVPSAKKETPGHINSQTIQKAKFFPQEAKQFLTSKSKRSRITLETSVKRSATQISSLTTLDQTKSPKNGSIPSFSTSKVTSLNYLDAPSMPELSKNVTPVNQIFSSMSLTTLRTPREASSLNTLASSPRNMPRLITSPGVQSRKIRGPSPSEDYFFIASIDPPVKRESLASQISSRRFTKPDPETLMASSAGFKLKGGRSDIRPITSARAQSRETFLFENFSRRNTTEDLSLANCLIKTQLLVPGPPEMNAKVPKLFARRNTMKTGKKDAALQTDTEGMFAKKRRIVC